VATEGFGGETYTRVVAADTVIKTGAGRIHRILCSVGGGAANMNVYDNVTLGDTTTREIARKLLVATGQIFPLDIPFKTGLRVWPGGGITVTVIWS
jgi:hypothetical protein